ncbi:MAG: DUF2865 domain-containing protein [Hyphomicrobiaceae bacterium]
MARNMVAGGGMSGLVTAMRAIAVAALLAALGAAVLAIAGAPAFAQGWQLPWETRDRRPAPIPREPVYRAPPQPAAPPIMSPQSARPYAAPGTGASTSICLQLEQRLAAEANRGRMPGTAERTQQIVTDLRNAERDFAQAQSQLERNDCWEYFLFQKSLRRSRACYDYNRRSEEAQMRIRELEAQRQQTTASGSRSYADEIIRELARNNCGATYSQEARRREQQFNPFASLWQDEDSGRGTGNTFGGLPFATYRTLCVRLCDGYYFPVSFSTLPTHFPRDAEICQSKCAAPAELFYYQNPGGAVEQMVSQRSSTAYTSLRTAFKYRKEYVKGCSCKVAEYAPDQLPPGTPQRAEAPATGGSSWSTVTTGTLAPPAQGRTNR